MAKKKIVFITIEFAGIKDLFDYPKHLPLPRLNEVIHFNGKYGTVVEIKHMTEVNVTDIRITCRSYS